MALTATVMLAASWGTWTDPLIDAGREIYIPWRLHAGDLLYRDMAHEYSPLSPFINAAWLSAFGAGYHSLQIGNALILGGILVLLFRLLRRVASPEATTLAAVFGVLVFAFGQYGSRGNYNYLSPYSHQMTHGLLFSLAMILALLRWMDSGQNRLLSGAGFCLGLVFLTKYEFFIAALAAVGVCFGLSIRGGRRPGAATLGIFGVSAVLPALGSVAGLVGTGTPIAEAFRATLGPYPYMLAPGLASSAFYAHVSGLDRPMEVALHLLLWCGLYAGLVLSGEMAGVRTRNRAWRSAAAFAVPLVVLLLLKDSLPWGDCLGALPFVLGGRLVFLWRSNSWTSALREEAVVGAFALTLLFKTLLAPQMHGYGFALAFPGTLLAVVLAWDRLPSWAGSRGLDPRLFLAATAGLVTAVAIVHLVVSSQFRTARTWRLGEGSDSILTAGRGRVLGAAVEVVRAHVRENEAIAVFPEGAFVNYLARRRSTRHFVFLPPEFAMYGESTVLERLREDRPGHALVWSSEVRPMSEYGCSDYLRDCVPAIGDWLREEYAPTVIGMAQGQQVFVLLSRKTGAPLSPPTRVEIRLEAESAS